MLDTTESTTPGIIPDDLQGVWMEQQRRTASIGSTLTNATAIDADWESILDVSADMILLEFSEGQLIVHANSALDNEEFAAREEMAMRVMTCSRAK